MQPQRKPTLKTLYVRSDEIDALIKVIELAKRQRVFPDVLLALEENLLTLNAEAHVAKRHKPASDEPCIIPFPKH